MSISVLTLSVRHEGLKLVEKSLKRQTYRDFEWVIVSPEKPTNLTLPFVWVKDAEKKPGNYWSIYASSNLGVKACQHPLIVSWQDYTYTNPDTLERFWRHYQTEPKTIVSAVGNKYTDETFTVMTWKDPRERNDILRFYECYPNDIEINLASFAKEAFYAVGGFDETLDKYSSLCGLDVLVRLDKLGGWAFKLNQDIKSYSLEHGRLPNWSENEPFNGPWQAKQREYLDNPVLHYLP